MDTDLLKNCAMILNPPPGYLGSLGQAAHAAPDGRFWLSSPKKTSKIASDLSRDIVWELMKVTVPGLRPVMQISIDETWSALRFRPTEKVGK